MRLICLLLLATFPVAAAVEGGGDVCPPTSGTIVINEIMYDPPGNPDVEYVELYNNGASAVDLTGWYLLDDLDTHDRCFLAGTLNPGEYLVVAGFLDLFSNKYPGVTNVNVNEFDDVDPEGGFVLGDGGDQVRLFNPSGVPMDCVLYDDVEPWPVEPDGDGPSLELLFPGLDNTLASSWEASTNGPPEGTPGSQNSVFTADQPPIVGSVARDIPLPTSADTVTITAFVTDIVGVSTVELLVDTGSGFVPQPMFDDGAHGDGPAGNSTYGAFIPAQAPDTLVRYYVLATDTAQQIEQLPVGAPGEYFAFTVDHQVPQLVINEILALNINGILDETGTTEDWVEIRNAGPHPVDMSGMFMSNAFSQTQEWQVGSEIIQPGEYMIFWTDDDVPDGPRHTNFKLSASGAEIVLWESVDKGNVMVDGFKFGVQSADVSFGYFPDDADAPEYLAVPTPGASNDSSSVFSGVCINEFQTTSAMGGIDDWVELYNRGDTLVNLAGWHMTDEVDQPTKFTFPPNVFIAPGSYLVVNELVLGFAFSSTGSEVIMLTDAAGAGMDFFDYGPQTNDISQGRFGDGTGNWHFFETRTQGFQNSCSSGAALDPVTGLVFDSPTVMSWDAAVDAEGYDVVAIDLGALIAGEGNFAGAVVDCPANNRQRTEAWAGSTPEPGQGLAYTVRAVDFSCGTGTFDTLAGSQAASRDSGIDSASAACP